jgi:hypothetical protein
MKNTTHAKIPVESWEQVVVWLSKTHADGHKKNTETL